MTSSGNARVVERFEEEAINQGRLQVMDEIVAEDFVELEPLPGQRQGREGLKDVIGMLRTAFPDIRWMCVERICEGEKVVSRFLWTGTQKGAFLGIPATDRSVSVKGVVIDRIAGGPDGREQNFDGYPGPDAAAWGCAVVVLIDA